MVTVFDGLSGIGTSVAHLDDKFTMSFSSLPMLAIAAIGFALASLEYKRTSTLTAMSSASGKQDLNHADDEERLMMTNFNHKNRILQNSCT